MAALFNVGWGFTKACNLNCKHCYNSSGGKKGKTELSLEQAKRVIDKLAKNGIQTINYGTGESGLVPEFWDVVKYADSKGIVQGLTTSGWSVNKDSIKLVKKYLNDVDVSIDYPNEKDHNWFRGSSKAWKWAINALELLKEYKIDFSIVVCITSKNCSKSNIKKLLELSKKYGCDLRVNWFRPTGRGKLNKEFKLSVRQVNETFKYLVENSIIKAIPDPYFSAVLGINSRKGCPCGKESFRITPSAIVVPCVYFTKEMDNLNILECDFKDIIKSKPFRDINNRDIEFCQDCEYFESCNGGCASRALLEFGSMNEPDAFCYKKAGIKKNPFRNLKFVYKPEGQKVHENYLCTIIVKAK